jgi:predicted nuclease of predicted toxin-antitoxin system
VKVKLDENIPASVATRLVQLGVDAETVLGEGLRGRPDTDVWSAAQCEEPLLVTQDLDFSGIRIFKPGTHHGLLLVRLPDSEQWRVGDYVCAWLSAPESPAWSGCVVVATKNKVRVRRP